MAGPKKKKQKTRQIVELNGYEWYADEKFEIDRLLDKKVEQVTVGKKKKRKQEIIYYKVLWKNWPPEIATWEPESSIHDDFIDEYEAAMDAEAELEAEEALEDDGDDE